MVTIKFMVSYHFDKVESVFCCGMGACVAHLKILTAMRRIDRSNCQSNRELASVEYCPCELLEDRTRLE